MAEVNHRPKISIVVPCFNEEEVFPHLREALENLLTTFAQESPEVLLVDDGSKDRTWEFIQEFARANPHVAGVSMSRNFGHQAALTCGYDLAQGEAVICLDADLQDPPEVIGAMVDAWKQGADVVYAVRRERPGESRFKRWTAALFYRLMQAIGAKHVRADSGDFRLLSRRALDALGKLRETHRFIRGMVGWLGFRTAEVYYDRRPRKAGVTKYPFLKMMRLAMDAAVSFSIFPLRLAYYFAGALTLANFAYLAFAGVQYLSLGEQLVPGWLSLILAVVGFGSLNMFCLGIMGEYIGRIYEQSKGRPLYLVKEVLRNPSVPSRQPLGRAA
jgi:polyisoprenyl-phosphate glycosyltransferase